jgi:hypothetical protein
MEFASIHLDVRPPLFADAGDLKLHFSQKSLVVRMPVPPCFPPSIRKT